MRGSCLRDDGFKCRKRADMYAMISVTFERHGEARIVACEFKQLVSRRARYAYLMRWRDFMSVARHCGSSRSEFGELS